MVDHLFTTSRYASEETRNIAKKLARRQKEKYVARGKKTIDEVVAAARKNGDERITVVEEKGSKPYRIAVLAVDELGNWSWVEERLIIEG